MRYKSTNNKVKPHTLKDAVLKGLADDNGLFCPESIPKLDPSLISGSLKLSFHEIAFSIASSFVGDEIPGRDLKEIIQRAYPFDAPLKQLDYDLFVLELFHGPTLAFKDFGARFMAELVAYYNSHQKRNLTVLVATSGDTGSAVAQAFYEKAGIDVVILYPSGKVSNLQEKQLTTLGGNVRAIEIEGNFDDCQKLVKEAFLDQELTSKITLTSANSINIARLIPQSFYYVAAYLQLPPDQKPLVISVPSGNFGNLSAGLLAKIMGLPVQYFVAATNINDVVPDFLRSGQFRPKPSIATISNAMDVGNPSNFSRMTEILGSSPQAMLKHLTGYSFTDQETRDGMLEIFERYNYIPDPHGAIGYLGLKKYLASIDTPSRGIFLETAHPAKFHEVVSQVIKSEVPIPPQIAKLLNLEKKSTRMKPEYRDLKHFLLEIAPISPV